MIRTSSTSASNLSTPVQDSMPTNGRQSRGMSFIESVANVSVGCGFAVATQILIFPIFGLHATLAQNLKIGAVFTLVSIGRTFAMRRLFAEIRVRSVDLERVTAKSAAVRHAYKLILHLIALKNIHVLQGDPRNDMQLRRPSRCMISRPI